MKIKFTYVSFAYIKFTYDEVCLQTLFSYHFHVVTHFTMFDLTRRVNKRGSISVFVQFSRLQAPKLFYKGKRVPNTVNSSDDELGVRKNAENPKVSLCFFAYFEEAFSFYKKAFAFLCNLKKAPTFCVTKSSINRR